MKCATVVRAKRSNVQEDDNTEGCKFHISVSLSNETAKGEGTWTFINVQKQHTCRVDEIGRKRCVKSNILMAGSDALCSFVPGNRRSHGNTRQVQDIARASGLDLKKGQTFNIVKTKSQHTIEYQLASYWFLDPIISCLRKEDPGGTYLLEYAATTSGSTQFSRFYVAPSHAKLNFVGSLKLLGCAL